MDGTAQHGTTRYRRQTVSCRAAAAAQSRNEGHAVVPCRHDSTVGPPVTCQPEPDAGGGGCSRSGGGDCDGEAHRGGGGGEGEGARVGGGGDDGQTRGEEAAGGGREEAAGGEQKGETARGEIGDWEGGKVVGRDRRERSRERNGGWRWVGLLNGPDRAGSKIVLCLDRHYMLRLRPRHAPTHRAGLAQHYSYQAGLC
jgi:hypothetical protein